MKIGLLRLPTIPPTGEARQCEGPIVTRADCWQRADAGRACRVQQEGGRPGLRDVLVGDKQSERENPGLVRFPPERAAKARYSPHTFFSFVDHSFTKGG